MTTPAPKYHELSWFDPRRGRAMTIRVTALADARTKAKDSARRIRGGIEIWAVYTDPATGRPARSTFVETVSA